MTTDVWMAVRRKGLAYHRIVDGDERTVCDRFIGDLDAPMHGLVISEDEAANVVQGDECRTCYGSVRTAVRRG